MSLIDSITKAEHNSGYKYYTDQAPENGIWLEFGVSSGGTLKQIASLTTKTVYGFDSWEGLPENWLTDKGTTVRPKGEYKANPPTDLPSNCVLISGLFEDSIPKFCKEISEPVSLMHIDCDLYSSTKTIFDNFENKFQNGSIILFDELYNYDGWELHEYKAFNEFLEKTKYNYTCLGKYGNHQYGYKIFK